MSEHVASYLDLKDEIPYASYRAQLNRENVYWDEGMKAWMVFDWEGCTTVQRDEGHFDHPYLGFPGAVRVQGGARQVLMLHGEDHTRVHRFLTRHFSRPMVETYRQRYIAPLVARMLAGFQSQVGGDLDQQFVEYLPSYVICVLLGVPIDDEPLLARCKHWNDDIMRWSETFGDDPAVLADALASADHLAEVLMPIVLDRRDHPTDDFISALWREGQDLLADWDEYDVLAQARVLLFAGSETTSHLIGNAIFQLLEDHQLRDSLAADPSQVDAFIEEILRFYGVVHFRVRTAATDVELSGCPMKQGDRVHAVLASANRDPARFAHPDTFDIARPNPRNHLAFGVGPRMCVGANLARGEACEVIRQMLALFPDLRWDDDGREASHLAGHMNRSFRPLSARWDSTVGTGS
jgi:cytochrome P450